MKKIMILILFIIFLLSQKTLAMEKQNIEIFHPREDRVVKTLPLTKEINSLILNWVQSIDEIYPKANIFDDNGYVIKFPINSSEKIKNKFIEIETNEVYVLIPEDDDPFFMILNKENQPICFTFSGDIGDLSTILDFNFDSL